MSLRAVQPSEPLLRGVEQAVPLAEAVQAVRQDRRQDLVDRVEEADGSVTSDAMMS